MKVVLALSCLALVLSVLAIGVALSQEIKPEDANVIQPLNTKSDIEKAVDQLVKIHEFCWENKRCTVLKTEDYIQINKELQMLRRKVKEQCS